MIQIKPFKVMREKAHKMNLETAQVLREHPREQIIHISMEQD